MDTLFMMFERVHEIRPKMVEIIFVPGGHFAGKKTRNKSQNRYFISVADIIAYCLPTS
jgi:hypothetical protein